MSHLDPIAYTYMADHHCEGCAYKAFPASDRWPGVDASGNALTDGEGNEVGAVFSTDEWYANDVYGGRAEAVLVCGTCRGEIERIDLRD